MEDQINIREEIINLRKELNELKRENKTLHQKINEQSLEIQNMKTEYKCEIDEMNSEINSLKENMKNNNNFMDNAPPLSNYNLTPFSKHVKNLDNIKTTKGEDKGEYITSISFFISNSIDLSVAQLNYYGFKEIEGDIRKGAGDLFCVLGCKYEIDHPYITNIIGSVSDNEEPVIIYEKGIKYTAVKDPLNNSDIHKGSGGNYLYLYYTNDPKAGKPIKNIKTVSTQEFLNLPNIVKYSTRHTKYNKPFEPLDCNRGRGNIFKKSIQNYIFIERE